ncbi:MAG: Ig-like domain-containing protein [Cytophagales bacterium]|nr:Ig-like domain-containing protein [Cytophagales bacterium]
MAMSLTCFQFDPEQRPWRFFWLFVALVFVTVAQGQDLDQDNDGIPDSFEKGLGNLTFGSAFNLQGVDNSAVAINETEVQLTLDQRSLRGSAMSFGMIDLMDDFSFTIEAYFGINRNQDLFSSSGADGIAIVFHNDPAGSYAIGVDGEGIGAQGIQNGVVLEIDTYGNGDTGANDPMRGDYDNHTDIWDSDDTDRVSLIGGYQVFKEGEASPLEDGTYHEVIFTWVSSTGTLSFTVDGMLGGELSLGSAEAFINTYFAGSSAVHFGFTASTGAARNEHRVSIIDLQALPVVMDTDNDGIYDHLDLDSDNDGIYDAVEAGHGADHIDGVVSGSDDNGDGIPDAVQNGTTPGNIDYSLNDTDGDGSYDHQDLDSDGDGCYDVVEMGFVDEDQDGVLGSGVPTVNRNGLVVGMSGYTVANIFFLDETQNGCLLASDLGDAGDGDDAYVIFYEDQAPLNLMDDPSILNMNDRLGTLSIEVAGIIDGNNEQLQIGGLTIPLVTNNQVVSLEVSEIELELSWQSQALQIKGAGSSSLSVAIMEAVLDQMTYHHADTLLPTTGERTLNIIVDDGVNQSASNWVRVLVEPINDLPFADSDTVTLNELNAVEIEILQGDMDWDGEINPLSIEVVSETGKGALSVNASGVVTYTPEVLATGHDSFVYQVQDDEGGMSNEAIVVIYMDVEPEEDNTPPIARDTLIMVRDLQGITFDLGPLITEPDGDRVSIELLDVSVINIPGNLSVSQDRVLSFTPNPGFVGSFTLTYQACDDATPSMCDEAVVTIQIVDMDSDGDGTLDHEEDANSDQDLTNDDCNEDGIPDYLDADACTDSLIIGSVVTSNGDQMNDFFKVQGIERYLNNEVTIFNRWGSQVWRIKGYDNSLDNRRFSGLGNAGALPDGTYYYVINKGDNSPAIKGFLTLKNQ